MDNYNDLQRKQDFEFFLNQYDDIFKKYGKCYVSIRNKKIIGVFKTEKEALDISSSEFGFGNFIVQQCNGDETGYTNYVTSWELIGV